jgi:hypothetical protein
MMAAVGSLRAAVAGIAAIGNRQSAIAAIAEAAAR